MSDPASILFSYAMDKNIFPDYMADLAGFQLRHKANSAGWDRLRALLDPPVREKLEALMDEEHSLDALHLEAAFTAGLSFGLRFLQLL